MGFEGCSAGDLEAAAAALESGRLKLPPTQIAVERLQLSAPAIVLAELQALADAGFSPAQASVVLRLLAKERVHAVAAAPSFDLVVTGPDVSGQARDTAVVADQLFGEAKKSVLVVGFALYKGDVVFRRLAEQFDANPALEVTLCLDVSRRGTDTTRDDDVVDRFAKDFVGRNWPGKRLPAVYYDPRGLAMNAAERAVLHAKCVVVDGQVALVTSANPTPAALTRNIEVGVIVRGGNLPQRIADHFGSLIKAGVLRPLVLRSVPPGSTHT